MKTLEENYQKLKILYKQSKEEVLEVRYEYEKLKEMNSRGVII